RPGPPARKGRRFHEKRTSAPKARPNAERRAAHPMTAAFPRAKSAARLRGRLRTLAVLASAGMLATGPAARAEPHYTLVPTSACPARLPAVVSVRRERDPLAREGFLVVRFARGSVNLAFARTRAEAQVFQALSAAPGDPYAYRANGNVVLQWPVGSWPLLPA